MKGREKKRGPGRPAMAEGTAKVGVFSFRVSAEEAEVIRAAAERAGKPVTQWVRGAVLLRARAPSRPARTFQIRPLPTVQDPAAESRHEVAQAASVAFEEAFESAFSPLVDRPTRLNRLREARKALARLVRLGS